MPHQTYMTTRDKIETAVRPSRGVVAAIWAAATAASIAGMVVAGSGIVALGLGLTAAYSGFKTLETAFSRRSAPIPKDFHSTREDLRELSTGITQEQALANNRTPVPELADDISVTEWRKQLTERAREDAVRHARHGR